MRVLAVDIGGTHVSCGAVEDDRLLDVISIDTDSGGLLANLLPCLADALRALERTQGGRFSGIGFGFCGLVDSCAGRVVSTNHKYSDATEIDLPGWAQQELGMKLVLENDSRMALLGERHAGAAVGCDDSVMITLGTGIGTAVVINGKLLRGKHFQAGCLGGHFTVELDGRVCSCGARGCFEAEASTYALSEVCRTWPGIEESPLFLEPKIDFEQLFHVVELGDSVALQIRSRCLRIWAACALSLVHAYDPELIVLGGGVMQSNYPILKAIQDHLDTSAWTPWGRVQVRRSALGSNAALLGALPLCQM